jgi:hypothetical protein
LTNVLGSCRDVLLGKLGAAASRVEYSRVITQWEAQEAPESLIPTETQPRPAPDWNDVPDGMAALFQEGCKQENGHSSDMMRDFATQFVSTAAMLQTVLGRAVPLQRVSMRAQTPPNASTIRNTLKELARQEKRRPSRSCTSCWRALGAGLRPRPMRARSGLPWKYSLAGRRAGKVPAWPDGPELHTPFAAWLGGAGAGQRTGRIALALDGLAAFL